MKIVSTNVFVGPNVWAGFPVIRHLWLHYPADPRALAEEESFLLGDQILVAPMLNACELLELLHCDQRSVYLPEGQWTHLCTGEAFAGGQEHLVEAPLGQPPVFYKRGSAVGARFSANLRSEGIVVPDPL